VGQIQFSEDFKYAIRSIEQGQESIKENVEERKFAQRPRSVEFGVKFYFPLKKSFFSIEPLFKLENSSE